MGILSDIRLGLAATRNPARREIRNLGLTFLGVFCLVGGYLLWHGFAAGWWLLAAGALLGFWGFAWPARLVPLYRLWMGLAVVLGALVSRLLLALVFYLTVTPIGLLARMAGKDFLDLRRGDRPSYWQRRPAAPYEPRQTEKMY